MRRAMTAPGDREALRAPTAVLRALASENPRSFPVQMALGTALRKENALDEAMQAFERAAALVPVAREGQPARADGGHRAREEGSPAGDCGADRSGRRR